MALGDVGFLTPAESAYYSPGAYDDVLRAESSKMATYLAQMDMFHENLSETQRQFDLTYELKQEALELEAERVEIDKGYLEDTQYKTKVWEQVETGKLSLAKEEHEFRMEAERERLKFERERLKQEAENEKERMKLEQERLGLSNRELEARIDQIDKQFELQNKELDQRQTEMEERFGLERDKMAQSHEEFMSNQDFNKWAAEQEMTLNKDRLALEARGADLAEKQMEYTQMLSSKEFETKFGSSPEDYGKWPSEGGASDFYTRVAGAGTSKPKAITSDSTKEYAIDAEKEVGLEAIAAKKDIAEQAIEGGYDLAKLGNW